MTRFVGELEALQAGIDSTGLKGEWIEIEHGHQFRARTGATVNWYTKSGSLVFGGEAVAKATLERVVMAFIEDGEVLSVGPTVSSGPSTGKKVDQRVFVVHGHDHEALDQLDLILRKLGLQPFVLMNTSGGGLTIIEALEKEIVSRESRASFGIVLLTPDDFGYSKKAGAAAAEPRARQNVILELGMLMAAVGRKNVAMLVKGHIELPSDTGSILHAAFNDHVRETVPKLAERLRTAGFVIRPEDIALAAS